MHSYTITTERLRLRPLSVKDAEAVYKWVSDERVARYMVYPTYTNIGDCIEWLKQIENSAETYNFGFERLEDGELIGSGDIGPDDKGYWSFGYNLRHDCWGKGYATEAAKAMMDFARKEFGAKKFSSSYCEPNLASENVMKKCGLSFWGYGKFEKLDGSSKMRSVEYRLDESERKLYNIRRITADETEAALSLALEVFMEFEAPEYAPEGVTAFKESVIESNKFREAVASGENPIYAAFDGDKMIGIIGMRSNMTHICLAFVRKEYHRKGAATAMFRYLLEEVKRLHPEHKTITLNSSPYGVPFYEHIGFIATDSEQTVDGIRFTPMIYTIGG